MCTDTRTLAAGELFVALRGPRFNGNEFVAAAHAAGAAGAVVDAPQSTPLSQVIVAESLAALTRAAQHWRGRFNIPVIAVCRQQRQDQHQGDDGGDPGASRAPVLPRAAISIITSACR